MGSKNGGKLAPLLSMTVTNQCAGSRECRWNLHVSWPSFGLATLLTSFSSEFDMTTNLNFLGSKQLQKISCIVSLVLLLVHLSVFLSVEERILLKSTSCVISFLPDIYLTSFGSSSLKKRPTVGQEMLEIFRSIRTLPRTIRQIVSSLWLIGDVT